jgi:hypothetical protein
MSRARIIVSSLLLASIASAQTPSEPPATPPPTAPAEPPAPPTKPAFGRIRGRVFERGSSVPIVGATVTAAVGEPVITDKDGRFEIDLPPGAQEIIITDDTHEDLRATEQLNAGEGVAVDYHLLPLPSYRKKYQTTVRGEARHEGERFTLKGDEGRALPGTLGDPYRAVGLMPGVATPVPLLPLYVIRGASPGMNGFFLDGMRVPQLFHFLVGGGVVHPRLVESLDFYPGNYDASFGRFAGGIVDSQTRPARNDATLHGEAELRLYDVSAVAEVKLPGDVLIEASAHFGYPGYVISLVQPGVDVTYWDYLLRADWKGLTLEAIGSYDAIQVPGDLFPAGLPGGVSNQFNLMFHRLQLRDRFRKGPVEIEAALVGGVDQMTILGGFGVQKLALSARFNARATWKRFTLFTGVDAEISRFAGQNFDTQVNGANAPDQLGDLAGNRDGIVGSYFLQGTAEILDNKKLVATLGGRVDAYHANNVTLLGVDPRLNLTSRLTNFLSLHAGIGLYQQPPAFPVTLPGIDTFALQLGLQRAIQGSMGFEAKLPQSITFSLTGFYQKFYNINDVVLDFTAQLCTSAPPESLSGLPAQITRQLDGQSFGGELLLRKHEGRFTGWVAYTLSRSERIYSCGLRPADFDQTHMLNVVAQVRLPWRLVAGGRLLVQSGRPYTQVALMDGFTFAPVRNNQNIPPYVQLDLRIDREWLFQRWAFAAFIEVVNATYSEAVLGIGYKKDAMMNILYNQPQFNGFRFVLPSIGLRARF